MQCDKVIHGIIWCVRQIYNIILLAIGDYQPRHQGTPYSKRHGSTAAKRKSTFQNTSRIRGVFKLDFQIYESE